MNLGSIYKDLGILDKALAYTVKSLKLKPKGSKALCRLGEIKLALGDNEEAKGYLVESIKCNTQESEAYFHLSQAIETRYEASKLIKLIQKVNTFSLI